MPAYTYLIKDEAGGRREGEIKADNLDLAMKKLSTGNQVIVKLEEVDTSWDFIGPVSYTHLTLPTNREV